MTGGNETQIGAKTAPFLFINNDVSHRKRFLGMRHFRNSLFGICCRKRIQNVLHKAVQTTYNRKETTFQRHDCSDQHCHTPADDWRILVFGRRGGIILRRKGQGPPTAPPGLFGLRGTSSLRALPAHCRALCGSDCFRVVLCAYLQRARTTHTGP